MSDPRVAVPTSEPAPGPRSQFIVVDNARSHNLRGVSCRIPIGQLTVVTGVSGSGKSTLAFDTLYAEGQRRYVASLSTYARQFLERLPRPQVDRISHLPPAIAIEQRSPSSGAGVRSTVGTATEILDHLRLLWARVGETVCRRCARAVAPGTVEAVAARIVARFGGQRVTLAAPLPQGPRPDASELRDALVREGWTRLLDASGAIVDVSELEPDALQRLRPTALRVVDRLAVRDGEGRARVAEAVASAFGLAGEGVVVGESGERALYREGFCCDGCGRRFPTPEPALFSWNSALGACETCQGFGRVPALDLARVVPDESVSLAGGAIAPFTTRMGKHLLRELLSACALRGVSPATPWSELDASDRDWILDGDEDWMGVRGFFGALERQRYKVGARVLIARYRRFDVCPDCDGARLRPDALAVEVDGRTLGDVAREPIGRLGRWLEELELPAPSRARAGHLLEALRARTHTANRVGLDYLSLDRPMRTLSGGEAQRIQLARALGGALTAALYVLDEPSVGLHARDVARLLDVMRSVRDQGNTLVVVEHAPEIVAAADYAIDLGPGAGRLGGHLILEGSVDALRQHPESLTGRALRGELRRRPRARRRARGHLRIEAARANNLQGIDVELPLGQLVCVTGVSGAGKSSLVRAVLVGQLRQDPDRGDCDGVRGGEQLESVVVVDPTPPVRSPRSNAATVSKAFDGIRRRFSATREARGRGLGPGWFSFNVRGGRCEACEGVGDVVVDMQFLEDMRVPCERCEGSRYGPEAQAIRVDGRSIVDVLALTLDEAATAFAGDRAICERLRPYVRAGLGYLTLGQPLSTLSGGEIQRLRLGTALADGRAGSLYVLDEPTTGLHPADVEVMLACLDDLIDAGGSVVLVEHNVDVIRRADWVIDLGPEGGPGGGRLVAAGTPSSVARVEGSHTGAALRAAAPDLPSTAGRESR